MGEAAAWAGSASWTHGGDPIGEPGGQMVGPGVFGKLDQNGEGQTKAWAKGPRVRESGWRLQARVRRLSARSSREFREKWFHREGLSSPLPRQEVWRRCRGYRGRLFNGVKMSPGPGAVSSPHALPRLDCHPRPSKAAAAPRIPRERDSRWEEKEHFLPHARLLLASKTCPKNSQAEIPWGPVGQGSVTDPHHCPGP